MPIRSRPLAQRPPPPQHRGSIGSNTAVPNIRRNLPASSVLPPHLVRQPPPQPVMLQHFHAPVPPPPPFVQPSYDARIQGWVEPGYPPAVGKVRICETNGCNRVLLPGHAWRICNNCLAAVAPKQPSSDTASSTETKSKVRGQDMPSPAAPSVASNSHQPHRPQLQVVTEPSHQPPVKTEMHHVLPLPASAVSLHKHHWV